ncbi:MAG: hypothetical protein V8T46_11520 [Sutterella seckii]
MTLSELVLWAKGVTEFPQAKLVDATPIGINVRSTVATYANVHDERERSSPVPKTPAKMLGQASDFSYNTPQVPRRLCDARIAGASTSSSCPTSTSPAPNAGSREPCSEAETPEQQT